MTNNRKVACSTPDPRPSCRASGRTHQSLLRGSTVQQCSDRVDRQRLSSLETAEADGEGERYVNILDIDDLAELFHCSREKLKRMARSGELPAFKFGKSWYIREEDLERFLSGKVQSSRHLRRIQEVSP
jgi:excisionase family DNA binding protein